MERMDALDASFLALETPTMHMHVSAVMVFEPAGGSHDTEGALHAEGPAVHFDRMRELVSERIHLAPQLRRRALRVPFGVNHPVWVEDPAFELDFHMRRASLPAPGGPNELAGFVADLAGRPLDPNRPLWEMHLVEGLESGHLAVVPKVHHAIIDGVSGAEVMAFFMDVGPTPVGPVSPAPPRRVEQVPGDPELLAWAMSSLLRKPQSAFGALRTTFGAVRELAERNRRLREEEELDPPPAPFRAPRTSLNGAISPQRRYAFMQVPLEDLRDVKRIFGGTLNDVVLAAVAGALRRLLEERGERPEEPLVAMVPISLRHPRAETIADDDRAGPELGNKVSAMLVSLATTVADPVQRLGLIAEGARLAKEQARVLSEEVIDGWAQLALPALSSRVARLAGNLRLFDHLRPLFNVVVSNVPGPDFPLWCAGSRLVAVYPVGPVVEGVGLNVTVMSYMGTLYVGLLGCRELVPEVEHLGHLLGDSVDELVKAARRNGGHWA
ncbi:MAG TPA: wax ester/triacylglycerol synthase family O-acyltransferase [Acidimicrobiales bacterium]|nr:wax ester/triacylglycerol synthase family O-acyltransferase [Acidimicrobiales bacterium]